MEIKEPVTIELSHGKVLYRGFVENDAVGLGKGTAMVEISDPGKILRTGSIDKEWGKITLLNVVRYIKNQINDPKNVIKGVRFTTPNPDEMRLQFPEIAEVESSSGEQVRNPPEDHSKSQLGIANWLRETIPMTDGDGDFDFRQETPYSALNEVCEIWETDWTVDNEGNLVIGLRDLEADVYAGSQFAGDMYITEYNLPQNPTPLKGVYVKGKMEQKGGHDDNIAEDIWNFITDKQKFETRAYSGFTNTDSTETVVLNRKNTSNPKTLKEIAKRGFLKRFKRANSGTIVIDALASMDLDAENPDPDSSVPLQYFCEMGIGDRIMVMDGWGCGKPDPGVYSIESVHHKIDGQSGWSVTIKVAQDVTDNLETNFWYFDPTDPDMTQDDEVFNNNPKEILAPEKEDVELE